MTDDGRRGRTPQEQRERTANLANVLKAQAMQLWKERVYDKARAVDPKDEHEWTTLAYGFFIAMGFSNEEALAMARAAPQ